MIDTDRKHIMRKSLAHVNRHMQIQKRRNWFEKIIYNPLKVTGGGWLLVILSIIGVIVFVENAQEIDNFFDSRTQQTLLVWWLPIGGILICLGVLWYRYKKM